MGDLPSDLRKWASFGYGTEANATMLKAADEIERLREALGQIAKQWPDSFAARCARAALKGQS